MSNKRPFAVAQRATAAADDDDDDDDDNAAQRDRRTLRRRGATTTTTHAAAETRRSPWYIVTRVPIDEGERYSQNLLANTDVASYVVPSGLLLIADVCTALGWPVSAA